MTLSYTLLADGSSDKVLLHVIDWLLGQNSSQIFESQFANPTEVKRYGTSLTDRIARALELNPCDLLFIHRDAEVIPYSERKQEILEVLDTINTKPAVCVVPVRMMEAWFLFEEEAIRYAAGNPNGKVKLSLPALKNVEDLADPKEMLVKLLEEASELNKRRLKKFNPHQRIHRVAELIDDFSPLRNLPAFQSLETDLRDTLTENGWG